LGITFVAWWNFGERGSNLGKELEPKFKNNALRKKEFKKFPIFP